MFTLNDKVTYMHINAIESQQAMKLFKYDYYHFFHNFRYLKVEQRLLLTFNARDNLKQKEFKGCCEQMPD